MELRTDAVGKFALNKTYKVITPDTPLEELDEFLETNEGKGGAFALVTDSARKFVLGVVTRDDLTKFSKRRDPNSLN